MHTYIIRSILDIVTFIHPYIHTHRQSHTYVHMCVCVHLYIYTYVLYICTDIERYDFKPRYDVVPVLSESDAQIRRHLALDPEARQRRLREFGRHRLVSTGAPKTT